VSPRRLRTLGLALAIATGSWACTSSSDVKLLQVDATGVLTGLAYLDNNGNGALDGTDKPYPQLKVALTATRGGAVVQSATTDSTGTFRMTDIPVGTYRLDLDPGTLGDSLRAVDQAEDLTIRGADTAQVDFGVSFPVLTFEEIRASAPGRRVFTSGIALNPRPNFSDGVVHLQLDSAWLRTINVARAPINTGDSLRVLGRTKIDNGQTVLDDVTTFTLVSIATIPQAVQKSTAVAASADGGRLDAALLRVRSAEILDTATVDGDLTFHVDDGSGPLLVVLRSFLQLDASAVRPDTVIRARDLTGLLTPRVDETGQTHWRLLPRGGADVSLEVKQADLVVKMDPDTITVQRGDTLTFRIVTSNAGPLGASGVQVVDTVPGGFTFVSATATHGTYDANSATWALDTLAVGKSDTLNLRAVVVDSVGVRQNRVRVLAPSRQVDPNGSNNADATNIAITPAPTPAPIARAGAPRADRVWVRREGHAERPPSRTEGSGG